MNIYIALFFKITQSAVSTIYTYINEGKSPNYIALTLSIIAAQFIYGICGLLEDKEKLMNNILHNICVP